ncbi:unnamed protein product [Medioppia subpectinata]|uniref:Fe2OG dioxygenase domain-containing protein n=1 Tax=Medioppia subpectinata TaxID=1979941 RepID=A0A7R9L3L0_9ACAR|nr:unnamed protein product [Medioppia subpectinata]CAG2114618.1 unnamed protein product [Medioppia subpectinata]
MSTAEDMNVIRYSVGGYYGHHYDSFHMIPGGPVTGPQRIATWISYLSDVDAGGATVFPYVNVAVWPQRGSALFWYNEYRWGAIDPLTMHGGCPVLVGAKWIATKWIRPIGQEFHHPCPLHNTTIAYSYEFRKNYLK